jgi:hypothetical protein
MPKNLSGLIGFYAYVPMQSTAKPNQKCSRK